MRREESAALVKADTLADEVLRRVAPLTFSVARSPSELEAVYRLRYAVVIDQKWARPEDFPDGLERDAFDDRALQIAGWDGPELVGTTRLVLRELGLRLPVEEAFDLKIASHGRVIDMGRTCRAPGRNDLGQRILWGLLARSWLELRSRGFTEICGLISPAMIRLYQRLGFRVEVLGEARFYWGEPRHPVIVRPVESIDELRWS